MRLVRGLLHCKIMVCFLQMEPVEEFCYFFKCFLKPWGGLWRALGRHWAVWGSSWDGLGTVLGGLGAALGRFWAVLGRPWDDFSGTWIFDRFGGRFWEPKGCPRGGILGARTVPKSIQNRRRNFKAKKLFVGSDFEQSWVVFARCRYAFFVVFRWF